MSQNDTLSKSLGIFFFLGSLVPWSTLGVLARSLDNTVRKSVSHVSAPTRRLLVRIGEAPCRRSMMMTRRPTDSLSVHGRELIVDGLVELCGVAGGGQCIRPPDNHRGRAAWPWSSRAPGSSSLAAAVYTRRVFLRLRGFACAGRSPSAERAEQHLPPPLVLFHLGSWMKYVEAQS
jgi:hypothetical protein